MKVEIKNELEQLLFDTLKSTNCSLSERQEAVLRYRDSVNSNKPHETPQKELSPRYRLWHAIHGQSGSNLKVDTAH